VSFLERFDGALARVRLRACTRVGARPVLRGAPVIFNSGALAIGDDFRMSSTPIRSHLWVSGEMHIGNRVRIGGGAAISSLGRVDIGDDVAIGDFVIVMDSDFHQAGDFHATAAPRPVSIGKGTRIGHRVVILPGTTIGSGAVVRAGSVVSGDVPQNSVVEGNPARARLAGQDEGMDATSAADISRLVTHVLGLTSVPDIHAGPAHISQWDSLGTLRLIVALEETFGIALAEDQVKAARSIGELARHVEAAHLRKVGAESPSI